jgi:hypothetical protein
VRCRADIGEALAWAHLVACLVDRQREVVADRLKMSFEVGTMVEGKQQIPEMVPAIVEVGMRSLGVVALSSREDMQLGEVLDIAVVGEEVVAKADLSSLQQQSSIFREVPKLPNKLHYAS